MKRVAIFALAAAASASLMSSAFAADLIIETPEAMAPMISSGGNWDGPYIGVFAGAGWGLADHTNGGGGPCGSDDEGCDVDLSGWLLGLTAGANFSTGSFVLGIAGDIAWADINGTEDYGGFVGEVSNGVDREGPPRGRAGFAGGSFMPYLTAGLAVAHAWHEADIGDGEGDATHMGLTAGVGVQVAVADNVSVDLQYRHSWYDEQEYDMDFAPFNPVFALETDRVTIGLNMSF